MLKKPGLISTLLLVGLVSASVVYSQSSGGNFVIEKSTIDNGGGTSIGGDFVLSGTIGQADSGHHEGGNFIVEGGFWNSPTAQITEVIFKNSFE